MRIKRFLLRWSSIFRTAHCRGMASPFCLIKKIPKNQDATRQPLRVGFFKLIFTSQARKILTLKKPLLCSIGKKKHLNMLPLFQEGVGGSSQLSYTFAPKYPCSYLAPQPQTQPIS